MPLYVLNGSIKTEITVQHFQAYYAYFYEIRSKKKNSKSEFQHFLKILLYF